RRQYRPSSTLGSFHPSSGYSVASVPGACLFQRECDREENAQNDLPESNNRSSVRFSSWMTRACVLSLSAGTDNGNRVVVCNAALASSFKIGWFQTDDIVGPV
ncbi:hypothetical protein BaRGS_00024664, partial [Batillaria attramentaria]